MRTRTRVSRRPIPPNAITDISKQGDGLIRARLPRTGQPPKNQRIYEVVDSMLDCQCLVRPIPESFAKKPKNYATVLRNDAPKYCKPRKGKRIAVWRTIDASGREVVVLQWVDGDGSRDGFPPEKDAAELLEQSKIADVSWLDRVPRDAITDVAGYCGGLYPFPPMGTKPKDYLNRVHDIIGGMGRGHCLALPVPDDWPTCAAEYGAMVRAGAWQKIRKPLGVRLFVWAVGDGTVCFMWLPGLSGRLNQHEDIGLLIERDAGTKVVVNPPRSVADTQHVGQVRGFLLDRGYIPDSGCLQTAYAPGKYPGMVMWISPSLL